MLLSQFGVWVSWVQFEPFVPWSMGNWLGIRWFMWSMLMLLSFMVKVMGFIMNLWWMKNGKNCYLSNLKISMHQFCIKQCLLECVSVCMYMQVCLSFFLTLCLPMFVFAFFKQWVYYAIEVYNFTKRSWTVTPLFYHGKLKWVFFPRYMFSQFTKRCIPNLL